MTTTPKTTGKYIFMKCRECGCTEDRACPGGCHWAEPGLCSACKERTAISFYTKEETARIKQILAELRKDAVYIGEDGDMCCAANSKKSALKKFKKLIKEECGDFESNEIEIKDIVIGWLRLPIEEEDEDECEWYASYGRKTPYPVFIYCA